MQRIFKEYGGVITTVIAIVALIGIISLTIAGPNGGWVGDAFAKVVSQLAETANSKLDGDFSSDESTPEYDPTAPELNPSGTIPTGAYYYNRDSGTIYSTMPASVSNKDVYVFGDYIYTYRTGEDGWIKGWTVELATKSSTVLDYIPTYPITDTKQTSYGEILETINCEPVVYMYRTFMYCNLLTVAPIVPSTIEEMSYTFYGCTELTTTPDMSNANRLVSMSSAFEGCTKLETVTQLPSNVELLSSTFRNCTSLETAPAIPETVYSMGSTFKGCTALINPPVIHEGVSYLANTFSDCTALTGTIEINASPSSYSNCFYNTQITEIIGKCTKKELILATK